LTHPCIKPKSQVLEINLKQRFVIIERYKEVKDFILDSISDRAMNSLSSGESSLKKVILSRKRRPT
jgi:flagellar basal body-associated protein FliL